MFAKPIETLLARICPESYFIFNILRKDFSDYIPIKLPLITWDDNYSVNIKVIDDQHMKLADLINDLPPVFDEVG